MADLYAYTPNPRLVARATAPAPAFALDLFGGARQSGGVSGVYDLGGRTAAPLGTGCSFTDGPYGRALLMAGSAGGYSAFAGNYPATALDFTLAVWFTCTTSSGLFGLLSIGNTGSGSATVGLMVNNGHIYGTTWANAITTGLGPVVTDGKIHSAHMNVRTGAVRVFVDAVQVIGFTGISYAYASNLTTVGALFQSFPFPGTILSAAVYPTSLTPDEVAQSAPCPNPFGRPPAVPVRWYAPATPATNRIRRIICSGGD